MNIKDKKDFIIKGLKNPKFVEYLKLNHIDVGGLNSSYNWPNRVKDSTVDTDYLVLKPKFETFTKSVHNFYN